MSLPELTPLPPEAHAKLQRELHEGEVILWQGQPDPREMAGRAILFPFIGGILLLFMPIFACVPMGFGLLMGDLFGGLLSLCLLVGCLPMLAMAVFLLVLPLIARKNATQTVYAITNKRAILIIKQWGLSIRSYYPAELHAIERRDKANGCGDLIFDTELTSSRSSNGHYRTGTRKIGFLGIAQVREVEQLLRQMVDGQRG